MKHEVRVICRKCDETQIVYCHYKHMREITDEEIWAVASDYFAVKNHYVTDFARAILRKAQEHLAKEKRESEDSLSVEVPTVCNVSNPIIQKIVDSTILPFAAAYLDENGDIKEFGPYQIHFDQEFPHIKLYTAEQFELLRKAQEK